MVVSKVGYTNDGNVQMRAGLNTEALYSMGVKEPHAWYFYKPLVEATLDRG